MRQQQINSDNLLRNLKAFISPIEQAKFLLWVEQNEACMQLVDTIWNASTQALLAEYQPPPVLPPVIAAELEDKNVVPGFPL